MPLKEGFDSYINWEKADSWQNETVFPSAAFVKCLGETAPSHLCEERTEMPVCILKGIGWNWVCEDKVHLVGFLTTLGEWSEGRTCLQGMLHLPSPQLTPVSSLLCRGDVDHKPSKSCEYDSSVSLWFDCSAQVGFLFFSGFCAAGGRISENRWKSFPWVFLSCVV